MAKEKINKVRIRKKERITSEKTRTTRHITLLL